MYSSKMKFAVSLLIIAWLFVSCALALDDSGDNGMQGGNYADQSYYDGSSNQIIDNGQGYDNGQSGDNTQYYMEEQPSDSGGLTDLGSADETSACPPGAFCDIAPGSSKCSAWITDISGYNKVLTLNIPLKRWARLEITTCADGNLVLYERKANGGVFTYNMGYASANRKYKMWFGADSPGTHTVWFKIGGQTSNTITFNVGGSSGGLIPSGGTPNGGTRRGGTPSGGISGSGCSVWTGKSSYGLGETITIYYSVSFPCTVQLTISRPDGVTSTFGPMDVYPGTYSEKGQASEPLGLHTVTLQAVGAGMRGNAACTFNVQRLAYFDQVDGSSQDSSQGNGNTMYDQSSIGNNENYLDSQNSQDQGGSGNSFYE